MFSPRTKEAHPVKSYIIRRTIREIVSDAVGLSSEMRGVVARVIREKLRDEYGIRVRTKTLRSIIKRGLRTTY